MGFKGKPLVYSLLSISMVIWTFSAVHALEGKPSLDGLYKPNKTNTYMDPKVNSYREKTAFSSISNGSVNGNIFPSNSHKTSGKYTEISSVKLKKSTGINPSFSEKTNHKFQLVTGEANFISPNHNVRLSNNLTHDHPVVNQQVGKSPSLQSSPALIIYHDRSTDKSVILAKTRPSKLSINGNKAFYRDAFDNLRADVRYTALKGSLEQDVLLYAKPRPPSAYGLNDDTTVLAVLSRLFGLEDSAHIVSWPNGKVIAKSNNDLKSLITKPSTNAIGFEHEGKLHRIFSKSSVFVEGDATIRHPVEKRLVTLQGLHFLSEEIPASLVTKRSLPQVDKVSLSNAAPFTDLQVSVNDNFIQNSDNRLASIRPTSIENPVVIDYISLAVGTIAGDFTFSQGETYLVSGPTIMTGAITIEGGAIIKFDGTGSLDIADLTLNTSSSSWAIFTSQNDDSVGETISGSTGTPTNYPNALSLSKGNVRYAQIRYADEAISYSGFDPLSVRDSEFFAVGAAVNATVSGGPSTITLNNLLVIHGDDGFVLDDAATDIMTVTANNITLAHQTGSAFDNTMAFAGSTLSVTDSLFVDVNGTSMFTGTAPTLENYNAFFQTPDTGTGVNNQTLIADPLLTDWFIDQASPAINAGSQTATLAGLYHYTTDTSGSLESNTQVDIGYHQPPDLLSFAVLATNSIWMKSSSSVTGNIGVNQPSTSNKVGSNDMVVSDGVITPAGDLVIADEIKVESLAVVNGDVHHNSLINNGTINGTINTPVPLPIFDTLPILREPVLTGLETDVLVVIGGTQSITPGKYGELKVNQNGKLILASGLYEANNIDIGDGAEFVFLGPVEFRVADDVQADQNSLIGADTGVTLSPDQVQFFVGKTDTGGTPRAVEIGLTANAVGHYYAPNGTIWIRQGAMAEGLFHAKNVLMDINSEATGNGGGSNLPQVVAATITPPGGSFFDEVSISLSTITSGATIHYTTDGTDPTVASTVYTVPFSLFNDPSPQTVKALAVRSGYLDSSISSAVFDVQPQPTVDSVIFDPVAGTFQDSAEITLTSATVGAVIYYTTDGTLPTTASTIYTAPFTITETFLVQAFATKSGFIDSAVTGGTYTIETGPSFPGIIPGAPTLETNVISDTFLDTEFLYTGANPVQTGVTPGTIEPNRAAVVRGQILDVTDNPLPGVTVTILDHPEYGQTISRSDGFYDLAVNGGTTLIANFQLTGYLSGQRKAEVPWRDFAVMDDIVMIQLDTNVTTIDLSSSAVNEVRGSVIMDSDGTRQMTILIEPGTTATMVLADGSTQSLTTMNTRITEYSVGVNGPTALPAKLPPSSAYTYVAEFSADEAIAAGAVRIDFNKLVFNFMENFPGLPKGAVLATGFYDRAKGKWFRDGFGVLITIISITNGMVDLDLDHDGIADDTNSAQWAGFLITDGTRTKLAELYPAGTVLIRSSTISFSANAIGMAYTTAEVAP